VFAGAFGRVGGVGRGGVGGGVGGRRWLHRGMISGALDAGNNRLTRVSGWCWVWCL
jgi:hypothetical protein